MKYTMWITLHDINTIWFAQGAAHRSFRTDFGQWVTCMRPVVSQRKIHSWIGSLQDMVCKKLHHHTPLCPPKWTQLWNDYMMFQREVNSLICHANGQIIQILGCLGWALTLPGVNSGTEDRCQTWRWFQWPMSFATNRLIYVHIIYI